MGNQFTIKSDVKLEIIDDKYLQITYEKCFAKKIYSRNFPALIDKNEWNSSGREALGILNLLEKESIDPFYTLRGDIAERFVAQKVKGLFDKKFGAENVEIKVFANEEFTYGDQWNYDKETKKGNTDFGGRMDIALKLTLPDGTKKGVVIEVKSKSMKDYDKIAVEKKYPESETYQGIFLANMGNQSQVTMIWVFFTEQQEEEIKNLVPKWQQDSKMNTLEQLSFGYKDVKYHDALIPFNREEVWRDMLVASSNVKRMAKEKRIPMFMFNRNDVAIIQQYIIDYERIESLKQGTKYQDEKDVEEEAKKLGITYDDLPY